MDAYSRRPPRLEDLPDLDDAPASSREDELDLALGVLASSVTRPYSPMELLTGLAILSPLEQAATVEVFAEPLEPHTTDSLPILRPPPPLPEDDG